MIDPITRCLAHPVVQSPMAGCTNLAFRMVARRRGMGFAFLEMVSAVGMVRGGTTRNLLDTIPEDRPVGAQIFGSDPGVMGEAARRLVADGFPVIDVNMGCPVRKVTSQGAGAALLCRPERAEEILRAVVRAVPQTPVTVKLRSGFEDGTGEEAVRIGRLAEDAGVAAVTVHGRTRTQGYAGRADWSVIARVKRAVTVPVIGNGDIFCAADAVRMRAETGCDGVMIGRGALGNPWLTSSIVAAFSGGPALPEPDAAARHTAVLEHFALERTFSGERRAVFHMRRIGAWYLAGLPHAAARRAELHRCETVGEIDAFLERAFSPPAREAA